MKTDLQGRIANLGLGPRHVPYALFEAVSNSIQAIAETNTSSGRIHVRLIRDSEDTQLVTSGSGKGPEPLGSIKEILISDNGIGFTQMNMDSFETLDSRHKVAIGGKGIGRLLWLYFFSDVEITSCYRENDSFRSREFTFSANEGIQVKNDKNVDGENPEEGSIVHLRGLRSDYRKAFRSKASTLLGQIQNHFLSTLLFGKPPLIIVTDGSETCQSSVENLPSYEKDQFDLNEYVFNIIHVKVRTPEQKDNRVHFCAHGRVVKSERIRDLPNSRFSDSQGAEFYYHAYVSSEVFDRRVNQERTDFLIEDEASFFSDVSMTEIKTRVSDRASLFLDDYLSAMRESRDSRINRVIDTCLPEYKYLLEHDGDKLAQISLNADESEIQKCLLGLHFTNQQSARETLKSVVQSVEEKSKYDATSFIEDFEQDFERISQINNASLISYLIYRKCIIDFLSGLLNKNEHGKFERETAVNEIFFQMGKDLDPSRSFIRQNLWLIDERLTYASYIASDRPLSEHKYLFDSTGKGEPDIACYFNLGYSSDSLEDQCLREVVLVEFKRPGPLTKRQEDPYEQCIRYIDKIREGLHNEQGKRVKGSADTRFYCYIVCELDGNEIKKMIRIYGFEPIFGGEEGYFRYNKELGAHFEIVPFRKILRAARRNHRSFFEYAGLHE
jgi:hypothetical protein